LESSIFIRSDDALAGFLLGATLIIAVGAQNAFVLRQGLKREQVLFVFLALAACLLGETI